MTDLIWTCPKCGGSNDKLEAIDGRKRWVFFWTEKDQGDSNQ